MPSPPLASALLAIAAAMKDAPRVLIVTHEHPDADGLGAMLALRLALLSLGKQVDCAAPQPCPTKLRFLPGAEAVSQQAERGADCAVVLDCENPDRLGHLKEAFFSARLTVDIDHHQADQGFAHINWCDPSQAATGQMVATLLEALGVPLCPEIATCLYSAIAADTGVFRFQNTTADCLAMAARLVAAGAEPAMLAQRLSQQIPLPKALLLGRALSGLQLHLAGAVAVATLTLTDFAAANALPEHTDGVIDELKRIEGIQVTALLREQSPGSWRVSLRSTEADVAAICRQFGGGGHQLAAGCELAGSAQRVVQTLLAAVARSLEGSKGA